MHAVTTVYDGSLETQVKCVTSFRSLNWDAKISIFTRPLSDSNGYLGTPTIIFTMSII